MTRSAGPTPDRRSSGTPSVPREREGDGAERLVTLAAVTGAHGVTGEVRLKVLGESIDALRAHAVFNGGALRLVKLRDDGKGGAIARFEGIADRTAAEALRGSAITVPRSALPPLAEGEFYHSDLLGLPVVTDTGDPIGRVHAVENFGATDIVEIEKPDGSLFMVPLTAEAVPEWNHERLVIDAAFAG